MHTQFFSFLLFAAILAGSCSAKKEMIIEVSNPGSIERENEIVETDWKAIQQKLSLSAEETIVIIGENGKQIPYQLVTNGSGATETLLFPVSLHAGQMITYRVTTGKPDAFTPLVYGRLVPERKDDFAWENNRVAFRIYGPALKATGEISNGMDFWAKKTESLVIDEWYKNDLAGKASYHQDHGEGLDFYKVGRSLGLGMTAPMYDGALCLGDNFVTAEVLDNGPLRISFKLTYEPYNVGDKKVTETRIFSLDAYSNFNKVTHIFEADTPELLLATGIVMEKDKPEVVYGDPNGIIAYETPEDKVNGFIYTAVISPGGFGDIEISNGHYLGLNRFHSGTPYTCYAGGGWSKAGFDSFDKWVEFVKKEKEKMNHPLIIQIQ